MLLTEEDLFWNIQMDSACVTSAHGSVLMCGTVHCYESLFCVTSSSCQINQSIFCAYMIICCCRLSELPMERSWIFETCYWVLGTSFRNSLFYRVYSVCRILESTRRVFVCVTWHSAAFLHKQYNVSSFIHKTLLIKQMTTPHKTSIRNNALYHT